MRSKYSGGSDGSPFFKNHNINEKIFVENISKLIFDKLFHEIHFDTVYNQKTLE